MSGRSAAHIIATVCVLCAAACSPSNRGATAPAGATTTANAPTAPGAPIALVATVSDGAISIAFGAPTSNGGAAVTRYDASCTAAGVTRTASGTTSPIVVQGLTNGTSYSCSVVAVNSVGSGPASAAVSATPLAPQLGAFRGNIVLGTPTGTSVKANIYAADQSGTVSIAFGTTTGFYDRQTQPVALSPDTPVEITIEGLSPDTRYFYRLNFQSGTGGSGPTSEYTFHTARPAGAMFVFGVQGDSHPERVRTQFDSAFYVRTLTTAARDTADFYVMLGDDFSIDQINPTNPAAVTQPQVRQRYTLQRPYLGRIGAFSPIFLVNGNHEQAARYLLDGTPNNPAIWAQNARNTLYSQPAPDAFYSGNAEPVTYIGLLRNYYAFTWGDALFVMIDPFWSSPVCVDNNFYNNAKRPDLWTITHGDAQYQWLKSTLERSPAKYKFVFAHHVMGTDRGGIEVAKLYEWGGLSANGSNDFAAKRPTWPSPIHQLFVQNRVTAFFQGHDHIWVRQQLDGVTYQSISEPADPNYSLFNADAYLTGDKFPNSGYTRVTVAPSGVKVEYVRTYLPADEGAGKTNGAVAFSYTMK